MMEVCSHLVFSYFTPRKKKVWIVFVIAVDPRARLALGRNHTLAQLVLLLKQKTSLLSNFKILILILILLLILND
jgi:hypothetical protein